MATISHQIIFLWLVNDAVEDTPTNNFATLNSVNFSGNSLLTEIYCQEQQIIQAGDILILLPYSSGKWYWEF